MNVTDWRLIEEELPLRVVNAASAREKSLWHGHISTMQARSGCRPAAFPIAGWWVTPKASMRAWEYAGTPVSLQRRGVYLHRDSLINR